MKNVEWKHLNFEEKKRFSIIFGQRRKLNIFLTNYQKKQQMKIVVNIVFIIVNITII